MQLLDIKRMAHSILENQNIKSSFIEYKKSANFKDKILKTACAFANNYMNNASIGQGALAARVGLRRTALGGGARWEVRGAPGPCPGRRRGAHSRRRLEGPGGRAGQALARGYSDRKSVV